MPKGEIAESWEVSCHLDGVSTIENGIFKDFTLLEFLKIVGKAAIFKALKMYVPDLQLDVILPLTKAGHSYKEIYENFYC